MGFKHKFKAKPVIDDKHYFHSKLEWEFYHKLNLLKKAGKVIFFLRQVPFHLPGGVKYVVDFVVFYDDGDIVFYDVKGMETSDFIMKKKMVEEIYPVEISIIKRANF